MAYSQNYIVPTTLVSISTAAAMPVFTPPVFPPSGVPGHIDELTEIAREWGCQLYFDSAHGLGSKYRGRLVGRFGNAEVFSFGPTKVLTCGEGGLIATNDTQIARNILDRRNYGFVYHRETDANYIRHDSKNLGLNGKMTEMGALVGLWALPGLESYVKRRQYIARLYREHLDGVSGLAFQHIHTDVCSNFKDFVVIIDDSTVDGGRNAVREHLRCHGIETASYFYPPVHELSMFRDSAFRSDVLTNTEVISKKIVSLAYASFINRERHRRSM